MSPRRATGCTPAPAFHSGAGPDGDGPPWEVYRKVAVAGPKRLCTILAKVERFERWMHGRYPNREVEVWIGFEKLQRELPEAFARTAELEAKKPPTRAGKKLSIMGYRTLRDREGNVTTLVRHEVADSTAPFSGEMVMQLLTPVRFFVEGTDVLYLAITASGHPLIFVAPIGELAAAAAAGDVPGTAPVPPHPFGRITTVAPLVPMFQGLAKAQAVEPHAPLASAAHVWAPFCDDAAAFISDGHDPEAILRTLWTPDAPVPQPRTPQATDPRPWVAPSGWTVHLDELDDTTIARLAPIVRERTIIPAEDMPLASLGLTDHFGELTLVLRLGAAGNGDDLYLLTSQPRQTAR